jgi:hypothetical protein
MARPKVEDDTLEKAAVIIDNSVKVPLPADELSANQQLRIIVDAVYAAYRASPDGDIIIDQNFTKPDNFNEEDRERFLHREY